MLWVLIRSASARCFQWVPESMFLWRNKKNINTFDWKSSLTRVMEIGKKHQYFWLKAISSLPFRMRSILVISKSKGLSKILWYISTLTYQICRIEEKINRITTFNKWICNLTPETRAIMKILWKRLLFSTIFCYMLLDFHVKTGTRFSLLDKGLVKISKVEITRVDCIWI